MNYQIEITDTIGYWECSYRYIKQELDKCKDKPVNVKISSPGGDVWEALKIYQLFKDHGNVTAYLSGVVASAATFVSLGAKKVVINKNTLYMIHNCMSWVDTWGYMNKEEIRQAITELQHTIDKQEKIDHLIATLYAEKTGKEIAALKDYMSKETWMLPSEVKDLGLADEISEEKTAAISEKMMARIEASGLPKLPDAMMQFDDDEETKPSFVARVAAEVAKVLNPNPGINIIDEEQPNKPITVMKKGFTAVMALLVLDAMTCTDNKYELNETQMSAINDALASLEAEKAARTAAENDKNSAEAKVAQLQAELDQKNSEIAALKNLAPEPPKVNNEGGGDDVDVISDDDAMMIARSFMGMD